MDMTPVTNPPLPTEPPMMAVPPPPISNSPKRIWLLSGLAILVLGILLGAFGVNVLNQTAIKSSPTPTPVSTTSFDSLNQSTISQAPPGDPTADWKTYEYSNFGYSFMLPKTYIVSENQLIPTSPLTIQSLSLNETNASQGPNDIGIFVVNSRLEDRLTEMKRDNFEKVNSVKIVKGTTWTIAYNITFRETQYLNYHNGRTYILGGRNTGFLDQILSTFKFVDQATPKPTCKPRPACLDATPRCMIAETSDMCPPNQKL